MTILQMFASDMETYGRLAQTKAVMFAIWKILCAVPFPII
jgi:hypothetical protein